jgi:dTDP-4-dehydrorhamnose reductase
MMKILVTGAKGQLGRSLQEKANETSWKWIFTDKEELNITDSIQVNRCIHQHQPDFIINTAAYTQVDRAEEYENEAHTVNVEGVRNLVLASQQIASRMIQISTDYVFDGKTSGSITTEDIPNPQSVYGKTKWKGEKVILEHLPNHGMVIRTSWLYSEYGSNFVKTMLRLSNEHKELRVVNDQFGCPTYAGDLANAIIQVVKKYEQNDFYPGLYHVANPPGTNWFTFAKAIFKYADRDVQVNPIPTTEYPTAAQRPANSILDSRKFNQVFGFELRNWQLALEACLKKIV